MKRISTLLVMMTVTLLTMAQGWPENYGGVMLQGFYWESYNDTQWTRLEKQAQDIATTFDLVWLPQSANCGGTSMGYDDLYWFSNYNSSFGNEQELRALIKTFKDNGIGTIADVVINHRKNVSNWVDFPKETYNGVTYELKSTDIVKDDDGGETLKWANQNGYQLSNNEEGWDDGLNRKCEDWGGMRDLDHTSENVQTNVKAYLKMLLEDFGYAGVRYDMVKGYPAKYTSIYNTYAKPTYSVGEYWYGNATTLKKWIDNADKTSAVFDFSFRYTVRNALRGSNNDNNSKNWNQDPDFKLLSGTNLSTDATYSQYAVTFVENHDTERRSNAEQDPIKKDTLAANAFLLAMPGTPCVFLKHWKAYKREIADMVAVRKAIGITNTSSTQNIVSNKDYYAVQTTGAHGKLLAVVGTKADSYTPEGTEWKKAISGYHYAYYVNGIEPKSISYPEFAPSDFTPYTITVSVNADLVGWTDSVNFWTWGGDGTHEPKNPIWPGDKVTATQEVGGKTWYYKEFSINEKDDAVSFVFSTGSGSPQTVDVTNVTTDKFFEVSTTKDGNNYLINDVTTDYITAIQTPISSQLSTDWYDLQGRRLIDKPTAKGIYIYNGRKIVIR